MKVWITKYAITGGIIEVDAEISSTSPTMIKADLSGRWSYFHGEGRDWHRTRESAVTRAEAMRVKKIASLKKSLKAIESLTF